MKLRSLELAAFRKFDSPVLLDGFGDGINLICGPNEFGKSTLLAAIRGVLFERHTSKALPVRLMQHHRNETSPRIALEFELRAGLHRIEKRFLHREPYARLTLPDGTRLDGDAAEDRLQALLGFRPAGKQGSKPEDAGMWGALWVGQRSSVDQPLLANDARMTVHECLEAEVGTMTGGERGQALLRQVREELARLLDGNGKPKGRLKEAAELAAALDAERATLTERQRGLASDAESMRDARVRLATMRDPEKAAKLSAELAAARAKRDDVRQYDAKLDVAAHVLNAAEAADRDATTEIARRTERARQIAFALTDAARSEAAEGEVRVRLQEAEAVLARASEAAQQAESAVEEARRESRVVHRVRDAAARAEAMQTLATRLRGAEEAQAGVNRLEGELAAMRADDALVRSVHAASRELARARAVHDAQATVVVFDLEPGTEGRVRVDGQAAASGEIRATADLMIEIPGIGRITVRPNMRDAGEVRRAVASAERALASALDAIGARDVDEADRLLVARAVSERKLADARAALSSAVPGEPGLGLKPGVEALRNHLAALARRLQAETAELGLASLPSLAESDIRLGRATAEETRAADALAPARASLAAASERRRRVADEAARVAARREAGVAALARLRCETEEVLSREPDQALAARAEAAARALLAAQDKAALLERARPLESVPMLDARIDRLEQAAAQTRETERKLSEQVARLESSIALREGAGLEEQIASVLQGLAAAEQARDARRQEADMLLLLRDTLLEAERAAKARYIAPLADRIAPYLGGLFPGAAVTCDGDFRVTELARGNAGGSAETLDRLSDGTQEQIAILSRLAFAELLLDRGRPAMVILDDALVFADESRMERMFDLLNHAARRMQILVLTCRGEAFETLGGRRLEPRKVEAVPNWA